MYYIITFILIYTMIFIWKKIVYILHARWRNHRGINRDITDDTLTRSTWKAGVVHLDEQGLHERCAVTNFVQSLSLSKHWIH